MVKRFYSTVFIILALCLMVAVNDDAEAQEFDYSKDKVLHVVGTAHLDTQWRWTIQRTINEYILHTLRRNFTLFDIFPNYTFSFEGAFRYMLMEEYYPRDFARLKKYIEQGRWAVCGSSVDAGDVNVPSPEAIMRNILYGNGYFRREFGKTSRDIFLPDCFGFGYALPAIASHCGLKGFSSQKLTWGSSVGIPFDIGVWEGVDGSTLVAELNPDPYVSTIRSDLSKNKRWIETIEKQGKETGLYVGYKYFGVGDVGGAPDQESVTWLEKSIAGNGPLKVVSVPADLLSCELTPEQQKRLPHYKGELLMTTHGTGCYTSQLAMKRWNRKNELLADAAERASTAAAWLGGAVYPREKLRESWIRCIWHQFHDDLTGTSIPEAYEFSWNDEIISLNQFSAVLEDGVGAVARYLDTEVDGQPVVVYNPLAIEREDVVEADVLFADGTPSAVRVYDPDGREIPSQIADIEGDTVTVLFLANVPSVGFAVFDVRPSDTPSALKTGLSVTERNIENERYRVRIDDNGDVASIYDKAVGKELLENPIRLALFRNVSPVWPAWEITYDTVTADPAEYVAGPVSARVVESGPVRAAVEITRKAGESTFTQRINLAAGKAGNRLEFDNDFDWRTKGRLLKAVFSLTASNEKATYDLGLGTIQRGNNTENLYEVPAQQWADITDSGGGYGAAVINDCLYGWDKSADNTLRLTLIHTPEPRSFGDQAMQDIGRHRMSFAVTGHSQCWRAGKIVHEAARLNQPLLAFQTVRHPGETGRSLSYMSVNSGQVAVKALKTAEESDEIVVRLVETEGRPCSGVQLSFALPLLTAREINGAEEPVGEVSISNGTLTVDMKPYQPRTFAVTMKYPDVWLSGPIGRPVDLPYNVDVISLDSDRTDGDMDGEGHTLSGDLLPETLVCEGIPFTTGPKEAGLTNALACKGQTIPLPAGPRSGAYNRLYILAAAKNGDTTGIFTVGDSAIELDIQDFTGFIGQWDDRLVDGSQVENVYQVLPAYIKRDKLAWVGAHRHNKDGANEAYVFTYIYRYSIDLPPRTTAVTLPDNENIVVFAMTASVNFNDDTKAAQLLYDEARATSVSVEPASAGFFIDSVNISLNADPADAEIYYTLDGSEPTARSKRFTGDFTVTGETTIKAIALHPDIDDNRMMVAELTKITPRPAVKTGKLTKGLSYSVYKGRWNNLPDPKKLNAAARGTIDSFKIPDTVPEDRFAVFYDGYIDIPVDGIFTFSTNSDDGSMLYLDDELIVDNDGVHGQQEVSGTIALKAGKHGIHLGFFEGGGGQSIDVFYRGPGFTKREIEPEVLWHR